MSYWIKFRKITRTLKWIDPCVVRSGQLLSVPPTCVISFLRLAEWLLVVTFPSEMSHDARVRMLRSSRRTPGSVIRKMNRISASSIHWRGVRLTNLIIQFSVTDIFLDVSWVGWLRCRRVIIKLKLPGGGGVLYLMTVIDKSYVALMVDKELAVGWGTALQVRGFDSWWGLLNFSWLNPIGRTMALGFARPLTEMITRNIFWS